MRSSAARKFSSSAAIVLMAVVASSFALPTPAFAQNVEEVTSFSADVTVREDGVVEVTERIDYNFVEPRHGIYRDIPLRYETRDGRELYIPIDVVSVGGGRHWLEGDRNTLRIRIGDPDRTFTGRQQYSITYRATGALLYDQVSGDFDGPHDELYWNVTGPEWDVPIRRVSAVVHLPDGADRATVRSTCYTGDYGSTDQDCLFNTQAGDVHFAANDKLTVIVGWQPTGLVARVEPKTPVIPGWVYGLGWQFALAVLLPVFAAVAMARQWRKVGRDKGMRETMVVQYDPPDDLRPAEMGVIADERVDHRDVAATITDLAVRGHIKIVEKEKKLFGKQDFTFHKLEDPKDELRPFEEKIMSVMFGGSGKKVDMEDLVDTHVFHKNLPKVRELLYDDAVERGYFGTRPDRVRAKYAGIGFALIAFPAAIGFFTGLVILAWPLMIGFALAGIVTLAFSTHMPGKTRKGTAAYLHALGFREYLERAEKYRLEWQEKERLFETFLPYAMAFGVVDQWTEAFEGLNIPPPDWYEGPSTSAFSANAFNAAAFSRAMDSLADRTTNAATSAPRSRSSSGSWSSSGSSGFSSGGGFSGGGGGGGGGGSW